jgi:hypothetical protein
MIKKGQVESVGTSVSGKVNFIQNIFTSVGLVLSNHETGFFCSSDFLHQNHFFCSIDCVEPRLQWVWWAVCILTTKDAI